MRKKILLKFFAIIAVMAALGSCSNNDDSRLSDSARLKLFLTDAPGDYDAVNIDVQDVMINVSSDEDMGWESLPGVNAGIYDLLELTGGLNVLLADNELPPGELKQVRLVLGAQNTVVIDGETYPLDTPSAMQSGLKIQVNETLEAGYTYDIVLDFDVDASIVTAGNSGKRNLKPVIRASAIATTGIISGSVVFDGMEEQPDYQVMVSVMVGEEQVSAYTNEAGVFMLYGVPAGVYDLVVTPEPASGYGEAVTTGVEVVNGETTTVETIVLERLENVGNLTGRITTENLEFTATVMVGEGDDETEVEATYDDGGVFTFYNLPVGTYIVKITPSEASGYGVWYLADAEVKDQETTDLGDIAFD